MPTTPASTTSPARDARGCPHARRPGVLRDEPAASTRANAAGARRAEDRALRDPGLDAPRDEARARRRGGETRPRRSAHVRPAVREGRHPDERCVAHVMSGSLRNDGRGGVWRYRSPIRVVTLVPIQSRCHIVHLVLNMNLPAHIQF